jgi:hypothetical protein
MQDSFRHDDEWEQGYGVQCEHESLARDFELPVRRRQATQARFARRSVPAGSFDGAHRRRQKWSRG